MGTKIEMTDRIKELKAVLDMPEKEQSVWCENPEHGNRQMGESLADLAFRKNNGKIAGKNPIEHIINALIKELDR